MHATVHKVKYKFDLNSMRKCTSADVEKLQNLFKLKCKNTNDLNCTPLLMHLRGTIMFEVVDSAGNKWQSSE